ncbi:aminotransferase class I/II-fold pyridoxal phosphate-dependent enzyme [Limosilactobacillus panis]|uniref:aminotransferase class I/II-fold pyridoxal phosphate-dependent enzyme n=1 Tax=Limosilactobacillus panis TaxID=47493 RepID=UPI001C984C25|nr:aminotransferase class I/II-fold pyridoxal phosphate-dependent enzyme [Limosilactobacillus panis]QZN92928.1 aminotransferase class I/II-fold pyridoxal phosphate-dependent enzyme [Limosilactobacillus panis]
MDSSILSKAYQKPSTNILANVCAMAAKMDNVIDLSVGDPNFTTPQPIIEAAFEKTKAGMTHYTAAEGLSELRQAICDFYQDKYQLKFNLDQVLVTVGAEHALFIALEALLDPGDEVIIPQPSFSPYIDQVKLANGTPVTVDGKAADGYKIEAAEIAKKITPKTKAIIINTPNNPTGNVMTAAEEQALADLAIKNDLLIFSDEIYSDYVMPGKTFTPLAKFAPDNTVTISGMSKSFAMTGWRIGYLIGPNWLVTTANDVNDAVTFTAPTMSQEGALYGLQHHDELVAPIVEAFQKRLTYLQTELPKIDWLDVSPVEGSIYVFADIRATGLNSVDFADQLLKKAGILVVPGLAFGKSGEGFVRIAATQPLTVLKEAVAKMQKLTW